MEEITREITIITDVDITKEEIQNIVDSISVIIKSNPNRKRYHVSGYYIDSEGHIDTYSKISNETLKKIM